MNALITQLIDSLGVDVAQAEGGAGLVFQLVKEQLAAGDFAQVAQTIPNLEGMISAAPQADNSGLLGMVGGLMSSLGSEKLGGLAELAGGFDKLGLDVDMVAKFIPIIISFAQSEGGEQVANLLKSVLSR